MKNLEVMVTFSVLVIIAFLQADPGA
ncbi:hypothetical protein AB8738_13275, partial [Salinicoccus roseus]